MFLFNVFVFFQVHVLSVCLASLGDTEWNKVMGSLWCTNSYDWNIQVCSGNPAGEPRRENKACVRDARRAKRTQRGMWQLLHISWACQEFLKKKSKVVGIVRWIKPGCHLLLLWPQQEGERSFLQSLPQLSNISKRRRRLSSLWVHYMGMQMSGEQESSELNPTWRASERNWRKRTEVLLKELGKALLTPYITKRHHFPPTAASVALRGVCPWSTSLSQHKGTEERKIQGQILLQIWEHICKVPYYCFECTN